MDRQSEKEEEAIVEEMEKLISDWQTYYDQSKKEKPQKLAKDLKA
jgi:hypothetical protein